MKVLPKLLVSSCYINIIHKIFQIENHYSIKEEFEISYMTLLKKYISINRIREAQEVLFENFYNFDYSLGFNLATPILIELIRTKKSELRARSYIIRNQNYEPITKPWELRTEN